MLIHVKWGQITGTSQGYTVYVRYWTKWEESPSELHAQGEGLGFLPDRCDAACYQANSVECVSLEDKLLEVGRSSFQRLLVRSMASNTAQALDRQWLPACFHVASGSAWAAQQWQGPWASVCQCRFLSALPRWLPILCLRFVSTKLKLCPVTSLLLPNLNLQLLCLILNRYMAPEGRKVKNRVSGIFSLNTGK